MRCVGCSRRLERFAPYAYLYCSKEFEPYKWTKEKILLEASKYSNRPEWNEFGRDSYLAAKRLEQLYPGLFNEYLSKMSNLKRRYVPANFKWTKEKVYEEASKFNNLRDFKANSTAYPALHKYKREDISFFKQCTNHMKRPK